MGVTSMLYFLKTENKKSIQKTPKLINNWKN